MNQPKLESKIGDVIMDGPSEGWIYCEDAELNPFLIAPCDDGLLNWIHARDRAVQNGAALPTLSELRAMYRYQDTGQLKGTFNLKSAYWSRDRVGSAAAWSRLLLRGGPRIKDCYDLLSVRFVRPLQLA